MCTVSFLPTKEGFILTSNRDETTLRKQAEFPSNYYSKSGVVTFPKDGKAGGTWIAASKTKMICLLNGAHTNHIKKVAYRHSRGQVVLDAFDFVSFHNFRTNYDFSDLEPHTLIMIDFENKIELVVLKWDGETKTISNLKNTIPHIWSSVTLYTQEVVKMRQKWFDEWVNNHEFNTYNIKLFHENGGNGDSKNDLLMQRENNLQTVSITSFELNHKKTQLTYHDLINSKTYLG